jgi:hypothetical protein
LVSLATVSGLVAVAASAAAIVAVMPVVIRQKLALRARPSSVVTHEHATRDVPLQEQQFRQYVREAAGTESTADQLSKLADLRDRGVITADEFESQKAKFLA